MTIEEGEEVFGKRWDRWSPDEIREFVGAIELHEVSPRAVPGVLRMLATYPSEASRPVLMWFLDMLPR